jgi:enoyl-[acyl-carrier protein] reductase II
MNANADWLRGQIRLARTLTKKPFGVNIMMMSPFVDEVAQVVAEEGVRIVTTGAGIPSKFMPMWLDAKICVIPVVASVAHARKAQSIKASAVIAEGCDSGGHIGELTTMALVRRSATPFRSLSSPRAHRGRRGMAAAFCSAPSACRSERVF